VNEEPGTHRMMGMPPKKRKPGHNIVVYDTETMGLNGHLPVFGCAVDLETGERGHFFDMAALRSWIESRAPCTAYAHNGSTFDISGILTIEERYEAEKIASGTKIFSLKHNGVDYRDSKHIFPMTLSQIASSVGMEKGYTPDIFTKWDGECEITMEDVTQEMIDYCYLDCEILAEALRRFRSLYASLVDREPSEIDLPLTTAGSAYRAWCARYWPEHWTFRSSKGTIRPYVKCRKRFNEYLGRCEVGGMTRLLNTHIHPPGTMIREPLICYDINSSYPAQMRDMPFPDMKSMNMVGATLPALMSELRRTDRVCIANLRLRAVSPDAYLGAPNIDDEGRRDWNQRSFDGWMCEPEIRFLIENGWEVSSISTIMSCRAINPFASFIQDMYDLRLRLRDEGDPRHHMVKLIMNSLFGGFGIKPKPKRIEGSRIQELQDQDDYDDLLASGEIELRYYDGLKAEWPFILDHREMSKVPMRQFFGFSSFVLSYGRVALGRGIIAAGEHGVYTDTDSVWLRASGRERFESMIPIGDELGQWKLETSEPYGSGVFYEPKAYTLFKHDGSRGYVRHKGVQVKDDEGNWLPNAGDLSKKQTSRRVVSYYTALRHGLTAGSLHVVEKKSRRFYQET